MGNMLEAVIPAVVLNRVGVMFTLIKVVILYIKELIHLEIRHNSESSTEATENVAA